MSKPFQLLKSFTKEELDNFQKLLDSGYLATNKRLSKLLKILRRQALLHERLSPTLEQMAYQKLTGNENIGEFLNKSQYKKLNRAMNDLLKAAEKFLMFEKIKFADEFEAAILFPELIERKQTGLLGIRLKKAEEKLNDIEMQGVEYHQQYHQIQGIKANLLFINNKLRNTDNYDDLQYHLDVKYILEQLNLHLLKITVLKIYDHKKFDLSSFQALKELINLPKYLGNPLISLSMLNIDLVEKGDDSTFEALLKYVINKTNKVPDAFLRPFYANLTNYCVWQEDKGRIKFTSFLFDIFNDRHKRNLLKSNDAINIGLLKNIITTACRVKKIEWAKDKLNIYIGYVSKTVRKDVLQYNSGIITFHQKQYADALALLTKTNKIDYKHDLGFRIVQIQCFYETDLFYETSTVQLVKSLKAYIKDTKKLVERQRAAYRNFATIYMHLYKFKNIPDKRAKRNAIKKELPEIKKALAQMDLIKEKIWLRSKIEQLENY